MGTSGTQCPGTAMAACRTKHAVLGHGSEHAGMHRNENTCASGSVVPRYSDKCLMKRRAQGQGILWCEHLRPHCDANMGASGGEMPWYSDGGVSNSARNCAGAKGGASLRNSRDTSAACQASATVTRRPAPRQPHGSQGFQISTPRLRAACDDTVAWELGFSKTQLFPCATVHAPPCADMIRWKFGLFTVCAV